jgi:hypothetical protein
LSAPRYSGAGEGTDPATQNRQRKTVDGTDGRAIALIDSLATQDAASIRGGPQGRGSLDDSTNDCGTESRSAGAVPNPQKREG